VREFAAPSLSGVAGGPMPQRQRRQRREEGGKGVGDAAEGVGMYAKAKGGASL